MVLLLKMTRQHKFNARLKSNLTDNLTTLAFKDLANIKIAKTR